MSRLRSTRTGEIKRNPIVAGVVLASLLAMPAQAACVSAAQATELARFALPPALSGIVQRCAPVLGTGSYLVRSGGALVQRFRAAAMARSDMASVRAAMQTLSGNRIPDGLSDATLAAMASDLVSSKVGERLPLEQCRFADAALEVLDPLPPDNVSRLTVLLAQLGARIDPRIRICAARTQP